LEQTPSAPYSEWFSEKETGGLRNGDEEALWDTRILLATPFPIMLAGLSSNLGPWDDIKASFRVAPREEIKVCFTV